MDAPLEIAILANGAPPWHPVPLSRLKAAGLLVCCDGACSKARSLGRLPDYVVGDGDSVTPEDRTALGSKYVLVSEQDTNDLDKAFRFACSMNPGRITILGATGLREDHALGNIFRLFGFAAVFSDVSMLTDSGVFEVVTGEREFNCAPGAEVSLFATSCETHVRSEGLVWPLDDVRFTNLYCATLNRTSGTSFRLSADRPVLLFRTHAKEHQPQTDQ